MEDLGAPTSYLALTAGTPVYDTSGERIGAVEHVLADEGADVFDGLVVDLRPLRASHRFADATQVESLYERGVVLSVMRSELHEVSANPPALTADPADPGDEGLGDRLRRAWDWVSGRS